MRRALRHRQMPHAQHDRLAKRVLEQILDEWGRPIIEFPVRASDDQRFDLWYPGPAAEAPSLHGLPRHLRLFGRMTQGPCAFEIFSRAPQGTLLLECHRKQLNHHHNRVAAARRQRRPAPPLFPLYVGCAGRPSGYLEERCLHRARGWPRGFYQTDDHARLWVLVLPELPRTRETLLLRLLGSPATRLAAERELARTAPAAPDQQELARLAAALRLTVGRDKKIPAQQREDFMTEAKREVDRMIRASEKRGEKKGEEKGLKTGMEKGLKAGMQKGRGQGMAQTVLQVLRARGITVTQALRQRIVSCPDVRTLSALARRAAVATSADDLFAAP